jgi:hypothetical protein
LLKLAFGRQENVSTNVGNIPLLTRKKWRQTVFLVGIKYNNSQKKSATLKKEFMSGLIPGVEVSPRGHVAPKLMHQKKQMQKNKKIKGKAREIQAEKQKT